MTSTPATRTSHGRRLSRAGVCAAITVNVYGEVSEETVDNMRDSLRDTVRELYDEFREEELQQMSLKNQYSF